MMNTETIFEENYEVLLYDDAECEYVGQNLNGDFVLGFLSKKLPNAEQLHLYFISKPINLLIYFNGKKSLFSLGKEAKKIFRVRKNCLDDIIESNLLSKENFLEQYTHLKKSFYWIDAPLCLPEIEAASHLSGKADLLQNESYKKAKEIPANRKEIPNYSTAAIYYAAA